MKAILELFNGEKLEGLVKEASSYISNNYCMTKCKQSCCKSGIIPTSNEEVIRFVLGLEKDVDVKKYARINRHQLENVSDNFYFIKLPCAHYKDHKCDAYNDPRRPEICKNHPISLTEKNGEFVVKCTEDCEAIANGLIKNYLEQIKIAYSAKIDMFNKKKQEVIEDCYSLFNSKQ